MSYAARPLLDRIAERFEIDAETGCYTWTSYGANGYGQITVPKSIAGKKSRRGAHRITYELVVGPVPDGLQLDHLCRNRACINPDHLEPVSLAENLHRGEGDSHRVARTGVCLRGHALTSENTMTNRRTGKRRCRCCFNRWHRERYATVNA